MRNIKWYEGYIADMKSMYNPKGYFYSKTKGLSSNTRCDDGLENMIKEYAKESPIKRAWCSELDFELKVKQAKAVKKVYNKKAIAEAKRLLNKG